MSAAAQPPPVGAVVLHRRRGEDGAVVERYTVAGRQGTTALLRRRGERALTRVEADRLHSSPAWAVQEPLF